MTLPLDVAQRLRAMSAPNRRRYAMGVARVLAVGVLPGLFATVWYLQFFSSAQWLLAGLVGLLVSLSINAYYLQRGPLAPGIAWLAGNSFFFLSLSAWASMTLVMGVGLIISAGGAFIIILGVGPLLEGSRWHRPLVWGAGGLGAVGSVFDWLGTPDRLRLPGLQIGLLLCVAGVLLIFVLLASQYLAAYSLRSKLVLGFSLVAIVPVGLVIFVSNALQQNAAEAEAQRALRIAAWETANQLDDFLITTQNMVGVEAQLPVFTHYLQLAPAGRADPAQVNLIAQSLQALARKDLAYLAAYTLIDRTGHVVADTRPTAVGADVSTCACFLQPVQSGRAYISPVYFTSTEARGADFSGAYFDFSAPVRDAEGALWGVLRVRYLAQVLQARLPENNDLAGAQSFGILVDEDGLRLAQGLHPEQVYQPLWPRAPAAEARLRAEGRWPLITAPIPLFVPEAEALLASATADTAFTLALPTAQALTPHQVAVWTLKTQPTWQVAFAQPQAAFTENLIEQERVLVGLMLVLVSGVVVAAFVVTTFLVQPIRQLTAVVAQLAEGNFSVEAPIRSPDEIGALALMFNQMTGEMRTLILALEQRVQEREHAEAATRQINELLEQRVAERTAELEAATRELEAFSYSVSHDLRAPLRAMDGFASLLLQRDLLAADEEARHALRRIQSNARLMGKLVDDMLQFVRLGRQPLRRRALAPADTVREVWRELEPQTTHRQIEFQVDDLPMCQSDPALLRHVYVQLLSNALKFTRTSSVTRIHVGVTTPATLPNGEPALGPVYFVRDNGVGFDMRYVHKLFGVFQRLHRPDEYEGTGMGLALLQRIVRRHGGQTWAEGQVGQGATFYFVLPDAL